MRYAAVVLANCRNSYAAVDFLKVTDALLAGGIPLDETAILPYDAPSAIATALTRLSLDMDGVFIVCDDVLTGMARESIESAAGRKFEEDHLLETESCLFAVLPAGARGEELVRLEVVPRVDRRRNNSYLRLVLRTVSAPAEKIKAALVKANAAAEGKLILHANEKYGAARIELIYDRSTPKMTADEVSRILASELSDYLYAVGDISIAERVVEALALHRKKISVAESFTGGGVGRAIVRVAGASKVYFEGVNTYNERAKMERLGVKEETLLRKGAVSDETAYEMAAGLIRSGNCDLAVATTGCAGPTSDGNAPVGLVYIAVGTAEKVDVFRYRLSGDRETITETAINYALFLAYKALS